MKLKIEKLEIEVSEGTYREVFTGIGTLRLADGKLDRDETADRQDLLLRLAELLAPLLGLNVPTIHASPEDLYPDPPSRPDDAVITPPPEENLDAAVEGAYENESSYDTSSIAGSL